jgi:hypothetical protein
MSTDGTFLLPLDRNGKRIRFGDTVEADRYRFEVSSFRIYRDGTVQVCGSLPPFCYDPKECVLVEPPFSERFKVGDIVGFDDSPVPMRILAWVPERDAYAVVSLSGDFRGSIYPIHEISAPRLVERTS